MNLSDATDTATMIADGHAFDKHVIELKEFAGISDRSQFGQLIFSILTRPDLHRALERGREAYWGENHQTVVIVDRVSEFGGTAFKPKNGKQYFLFGLH